MKVTPQAEEQIVCRWCGLFSAPGPACDTCGSPLLEVPWMQVTQLGFPGQAQPPQESSNQVVEAPVRDAPEEAPSPVAEEPPPPPREQMVQGLVVGGAALVYEDALELPASPEQLTLQIPAAATDQVAEAPPIEPELPNAFTENVDIPEAAEAPEQPQPAADIWVPEPPRVDAPIEESAADVAAPSEERPAAGSGRRWFLRRPPSGEQPEPEPADEAAVAEEPGPELPAVEEMPEPASEVAPEEDLPAAAPFEPEPEPEEASRPADEAVSGPVEDRLEEHPRKRRGLRWKRPAPEESKAEAEAAEQALDEIAALAYPATIEEVEPQPASQEPVPPPETEGGAAAQEAPQPVQPRPRKWLRRRGPSAPAAPAPEAPSEEAIEEVRDLDARGEDQASAAAPAAARPPTQAVPRQPRAPATPDDRSARPAASAAPAPVAPADAEPHAPSPWIDQPYFVEATPERTTEPSSRPESASEAKPSIRDRLKHRRLAEPLSGADSPSPTSEGQSASGPPAPMAHEVAPTVSSAPAQAPVSPRTPDASVAPSSEALAPPPTALHSRPRPAAPPPPPAPAQLAPAPPSAPTAPPPPAAPVVPPPPPAPVAPPPPPAPVAPPPTTSSWKSSTPQPPSAPAHATGIHAGPAPIATEITCPRCGQPSPRGLCEACEYALLELRELMIGLSEDH